MAKLPLTRPVYMRELGQRMKLPTREARRALRRIEHAKKVRLLFTSRTNKRGRLWTTESLIHKHCRELVDRPQRALQEVRQFSARMSEKLERLKTDFEIMKAQVDHDLSEIRDAISRIERRATQDQASSRACL